MVSRANGPSLVATVRKTLDVRELVGKGALVLLGVSGGPDSVAMLDVLSRLARERSLRLAVASVDHGLRPASAEEVRFVGTLAAARELPFHPISLGLPQGTAHAQAREARYGALAHIANDLGASAIAVAHTRDDQAETVLLRMLRGTGLRGLRGIVPRREDGVIRPLLDASRAQVLVHNERHGLETVADPSNLDRRYMRVRVRRELLPELAGESPEIIAHLASLADEAAIYAEFIEEHAIRFRESVGTEFTKASVDELPKPARAAAIAEFIFFHTGTKPERPLLGATLEALDHGGNIWIGREYELEIRKGVARLRPRQGKSQRSLPHERPRE